MQGREDVFRPKLGPDAENRPEISEELMADLLIKNVIGGPLIQELILTFEFSGLSLSVFVAGRSRGLLGLRPWVFASFRFK